MDNKESTGQDDFVELVGMAANEVAALAMRTFIAVMKDQSAMNADRVRAAEKALDMLESMRGAL